MAYLLSPGFEGIAQRDKSLTGWFFGLKLHLVINKLGQIINFLLPPANVADNNLAVLYILLDGLKGGNAMVTKAA